MARTSVAWSGGDCEEFVAADRLPKRVRCSGQDSRPPTGLSQWIATVRRENELAPSARTLHALALTDLLWVDSSGTRLDAAIQMLEDARALPDAGPEVAADLSAAYLVRSEWRGDRLALVDAAEAALEALATDPSHHAARFNLALALSRLHVPGEAVVEWRALETSDVSAAWGAELRRRLIADSLRAAGAPAGKEGTRDYAFDAQPLRLAGFDTLLVSWARHHRAGDSSAARDALARAGALGEMLRARGLDGSLARAVEELAQRHEPKAVDDFAEALTAYADGQLAYERPDFTAAASAFELAGRRAGPSSIVNAWAAAHGAASRVLGGDRIAGEAQLRALLGRVELSVYPALVGRIEWARAVAFFREGRATEALERLARMERAFERAAEWEHAAIAGQLRSYYLQRMGNATESVAAGVTALARLSQFRRSRGLQALLEVLAEGVARQGAPRMALRIERESARVSREIGRPLYEAPALLALARREADAGDRVAAVRALAESEAVIRQMPDGIGKEWQLAEARLARATLDSAASVPERRAMLHAGADFFTINDPGRLVPAYSALAAIELRAGERAAAESALVRAVQTVDRYATRIKALDQRAALATSARRVFDQLAMLRLTRADTVGALAWVERGRVPLGPATGAAETTRARPSHGEIVLDVALIGDTLLTWLLTDEGTTFARQLAPRDHLMQLLARVRTELELGVPLVRLRSDLQQLYRLLVQPAAAIARPHHQLLSIVADGELAEIPVGVSVNADGDFAAERFAVRYLETLQDVGRFNWRNGTRPRALLVGEPRIDPRRFPRLGELPYARLEVDSIRTAYPDASTLVGTEATRGAIRGALTEVEVFHFAGHTVYDGVAPERSFLALASAEGDGGAGLDGREVHGLELQRVRLVVLSSCESARGGAGHAGALAGLAGAFRIAGAGGVLGSLWRVRDDVTTRLMIEFHRRYAGGMPAAFALREAQLTLLRSGEELLRRPSSWAGFRYAGN